MISELRLKKRLKLLPDSERNILITLTDAVWDSWFDLEMPFSETQNKAKIIQDLKNPFMNNLLEWFFDIRSILVALRLRKHKSKPPEIPSEYWITRFGSKLISHWQHPDFGLKSIYPWVPNLSAQMENSNIDIVEELLLSLIWKHLDNIEDRHYFDFEALIIYLLRWKVINYWSRFNKKVTEKHILKFVDTLLSEHNMTA